MPHLEITTRIGCKNQCNYCPQGRLIESYSKGNPVIEMSFETFKKCVDKVPKEVGIHFSGFAEPYLNPECTRMMLYAHKKGFKVSVATTGVGISVSDIEAIEKIPFERFELHLPDNKGQTKIKVDGTYLSVIKRILDSRIRNVEFGWPGCNGIKGVHPKLKDLVINSGRPMLKYNIITRAGNVKINGISRLRKIMGIVPECSRLKGNVLLPNGDVVLCCMDWSLKHRLGNLLKSDYRSLFRNKEFTGVLNGLKDDSADILCRYCDCAPAKRTVRWRAVHFLQRLANRMR